ncbi:MULTISPECIES: hypothetical protein [Bacillus cereus group]|uniref:hypothetical protein n=1 Tax=Bacillus cereus group TaxID=86661 RepID=UPI001124A2F9|nr:MULTISPECIES: hypothetical protein [Bacillus cereus group]MBJ8109006.1 hypothetical protein [Bacillus cereus group sp. N6]MDA1918222.1 hypothetical protein [Bacillus cereus group sp. BcHK140]MEC4620763.1 hypothetical protein [Bacillus paranthracis]TNP19011.1 hypothetical protein FHY73_15000 [Bacillus tropicus]
MNELIFVNKDTNVRFMVSRSQQLVVPQIGAKIFLQDPNDVTYQGAVYMVHHHYGQGDGKYLTVYIVLKDLKRIEGLPF